MTKEQLTELIDEWGIENETIILEPQEEFNGGIIGVTEDKCHLVYSYEKLTVSMAEVWFKEKKPDDDRTFEDCLSEACEWVDYNTIRAIPYMDASHAPIIVYEFPEQEKKPVQPEESELLEERLAFVTDLLHDFVTAEESWDSNLIHAVTDRAKKFLGISKEGL